jgi:enediyne polyketide synthase
MLRLAADACMALRLAGDPALSIACENGPEETVVAGPSDALRALAARAGAAGIEAVVLHVSHAFHHPHMAPVVDPFRACLDAVAFRPFERPFLSSVSGDWLTGREDLRDLLCRQLTRPVRFHEALVRLGGRTSLLIEVGPGQALARLARAAGFAAVSVDACGPSLVPLLSTIGQAFVAGVEVDPSLLFVDRDLEPFDWLRAPSFLENPCGRSPGAERAMPPLRPLEAGPAAEPPPAILPGTPSGLLDFVQQAVAQELGLAPSAVGPDDRFDTRLHLGSLAVARIVAKVAQAAGAPMPRAPTEFAGATSRELAEAIADLKAHGAGVDTRRDPVAGVRPWIRTCRLGWVPAPATIEADVHGWHWLRPGEALPAPAPARLLIDARSPSGDEADLSALYLLAREVVWAGTVRELAVVHHRQPISACLRSLALEGRLHSVRLVDAGPEASAEGIARALARPARGFAEVRLEAGGEAVVPRFGPSPPGHCPAGPLGPDDVIWVTGGARGIAAECALALARRTGAALILSSRSAAESPDVAAILERALSDGVRVVHARADVLDREGLAAALARAADAVGAPTVLLHAAALNRPARIEAIDAAALAETLAPKVDGLANAIAAAGTGLRRIYAFGSIIGRIGLAGETHYALANALMVDRLLRHARANPGLLALAFEWSVWGGVGMGEALGVVERLQAEGIDPLGVDDAIGVFLRLVDTGAAGDIVVTGRFGSPPDLDIGAAPSESPRFLDRILIHYPGIELVSQTRIWPGRDRALADHRLDGSMILPGVISLEGMAQVARALAGGQDATEISAIRFAGPIAVPEGGAVDIRIAALAREDGAVEAVIRSSEDGFATERVRATFRFDTLAPSGVLRSARGDGDGAGDWAGDWADALYGPLFFHGARFRCVERLLLDGSRGATAWLRTVPQQPWFAAFDEDRLVLGDPAARDAALHCLQALVAHRRVVPVSAGQIRRFAGGSIRRVEAREREAEPGRYVFDICCHDGTGRLVERWEEAEFRAVQSLDPEAALGAFPSLLEPLLERLAREALLDDALTVRLGAPGPSGPRRVDGRPPDPGHSRSHGALGLSVSGSRAVGCDLEWERSIASDPPPLAAFAFNGEAIGVGEAWVAAEALRKIGRRPPVHLHRAPAPGLPATARLFAAGDARLLVAGLPTPEGRLLAAIAETVHAHSGDEGKEILHREPASLPMTEAAE